MLFYALVNKKYESVEKLLTAMACRKLQRGRNMMTALSATVIEPNIDYFLRLVNWEGNQIDLHEELVVVKRDKRSFVSYLCKMHRIHEGKNEDIKAMFKYLNEINFKIKYTDDIKRVFRQLIMSWSLQPGTQTE
jgi:hypothetical protein